MTRSLGAIVALISLAPLPLACGGSTKSHFDDRENVSSGGSDAASASSNGTGGSDAGGDGSGTDASTDGSNSQGSGASGGSGSGGDSSSSSSSSSGGGGTSDSTDAGTGGSGGTVMNPVPSDEAVDACTAYCERVDEAGCENQETLEQCLEGCEVTTRIVECEDELIGVFECSETAEATCNDSGVAEFTGCGVSNLAFLTCIVTEGPDEELLEPCEARCAAVAAADCPNDAESEEDCILGCTVIGTILPECKSDWQALMACGEGEEFVCNDEGQAQAPSDVCGVEQLRALACVLGSVLE